MLESFPRCPRARSGDANRARRLRGILRRRARVRSVHRGVFAVFARTSPGSELLSTLGTSVPRNRHGPHRKAFSHEDSTFITIRSRWAPANALCLLPRERCITARSQWLLERRTFNTDFATLGSLLFAGVQCVGRNARRTGSRSNRRTDAGHRHSCELLDRGAVRRGGGGSRGAERCHRARARQR
jgi:hypothetical protein